MLGNSEIAGVRDRSVVLLRRTYVALRAAHEALRHAQVILGCVVVPPGRLGVRAGMAARGPAYGARRGDGSHIEPGAVFVQPDAVDALERRLASHLAQIRRLKEENRRLCEDVAKLLGGHPSRPCS